MVEKSEKQEPAPKVVAVDPPAESIPVARLIAESVDFLGCSLHVAAGALHDQGESLTVAAAKSRVRTWLATPVQVERDVN